MRTLLFSILLIASTLAAHEEAMRLKYVRYQDGVAITGHGSAWAVKKNWLFSAAHNVLDATDKPFETIQIEVAPDSWLPARVLRWDKDLDVCILEIGHPLEPLKLADGDPEEGTPITIVGAMRGTPVDRYHGVVEKRWYGATARTLARVKFDHGLSGAPVVSARGVVGVAVCGVPLDADLDPKVGLFVPVSIVRWFIKQTEERSHGKKD